MKQKKKNLNFILLGATFLVLIVMIFYINFPDYFSSYFVNSQNVNNKDIENQQGDNQPKQEDDNIIEEDTDNTEDINNNSNKQNESNTEEDVINCNDYARMISHVADIRYKLILGENYHKDLIVLGIIAKKEPKLQKYINILDEFALGAPSLDSVRAEFVNIENDLILSKWCNRSISFRCSAATIMNNFIFVKKVGNKAIEAGGIDMVIEKVNNALADNDVEKAIEELQNIDENIIKKYAANWLKHSKNYLLLNNTVKELYKIVLSDYNCKFTG